MKKYLIKKTIIFENRIRINYHSKIGCSSNFEHEKKYAFANLESCLDKLYEIEYYDKPYLNRGFKFNYEIIEV